MAREPTPSGISPHMRRWLEDQSEYGWVMPTASWWRRLPVIRHIRAARYRRLIHRLQFHYYKNGMSFVMPGQYDLWLIYGVQQGKERPYG